MVLLPLRDDNPLKRVRFQYVTVALVVTCVLVFLWQLALGDEGRRAIFQFGMIPAVLLGERRLAPDLAVIPAYLTLLTSMFMHGGFMHVIGNMLYLWIFGDNIEDSMGHGRFAVFYGLCGTIAAIAHVMSNPDSAIPTIGASGAVSGVLGAYLVLHPKARVLVLLLFRIPMRLPAVVVLGVWIGLQFFNAAGDSGEGGGVAWWAHIGGFIAGALLIIPFRHKTVPLFDGWWPGGGPPRSGGGRGGPPRMGGTGGTGRTGGPSRHRGSVFPSGGRRRR